MSRLLLLLLNTITLVLVIIINGMAGAGKINDVSMGEVSEKYSTLITPAPYAFSIWGVIYLFLIAFVVFQWVAYLRKSNLSVIDQTGMYFTISNLANIGWLYLWLHDYIGLSVLAMFLLLGSLLALVIRLNMEKWDAPLRILFFVWWPIAFYFGWIIVASVTNVAAFLVSIGWNGFPLTPHMWTILMILLAAAIYVFLILTRNLRESALVGIWAFVAIAVSQYADNMGITITAIFAAVLLVLVSGYHGYKNRETAPDKKFKRGEF